MLCVPSDAVINITYFLFDSYLPVHSAISMSACQIIEKRFRLFVEMLSSCLQSEVLDDFQTWIGVKGQGDVYCSLSLSKLTLKLSTKRESRLIRHKSTWW